MRTSKFSVSKQLPITPVASPSKQLAVVEQLKRGGPLSAELQKYGITLESVTVTIPRLIVNCILRQAETAETQDLSKLTRAEQRVYHELKLGKYDKEIADAIQRTESTVHYHVRNILRKLGLSSRREILLRNRH